MLLFQFAGIAEELLMRDDYLLEESMIRSAEHVTGPWRYERIDGASHWMQLDAPERINELLFEFLR